MKLSWGNPLELPPYKGFIHPELDNQDLREILKGCGCKIHHSQTEILFDGRNKIWAADLKEKKTKIKKIVFKEFRPKGLKRLKTLVLPSPPEKAWNGATALWKAGIKTATPIAYLERKRNGFFFGGCFAAERILDAEEIRFFFKLPLSLEMKELLSDLSIYLRSCHRAGVLHMDLSDGNILVKKGKDGSYTFTIIDTNRIRVRKNISPLKAAKNLIRLGVPEPYQRFFLEEVFQRVPVNPFIWFWYRWNKKCFSSYLRFKKKLGLKKWAEKLKLQ